MTLVESSAIASVDYHPVEHVLDIVFTSGRRYRYAAVPADIHAALLAADSKGAFFNETIRDRFDYVEIDVPGITARPARGPRSRA